MKLEEGTIKAFKYWPARDTKYGDFTMSVCIDGVDGEQWYGFGSCKKEAWNRRVSEGVYEEVQVGTELAFPYTTYPKKDGGEGRSAKRSQVTFNKMGTGGGAKNTSTSTNAPRNNESNNPAEIGQVVNICVDKARFAAPKSWTWDDVVALVDDTVENYLVVRHKVDAALTTAKTGTTPTPSKDVPDDEDDDDLPF